MSEIEHAANASDTVEPFRRHRPGAVIAGRYKLLEQIGEGGMGTVWVAEQAEPVRRRVALKLIKPGMDSRQVVSRFEAERQALALMDHPHIAKVFDGGMTDEGRPFFVMEYVKGVPITDYCDNARLRIHERLQLFIPVCQAVQHAHQKGVIHRDLKPSNILVCLYDGQPVPKVIDFGLAKAMHQPLTEHTLYTAHGQMVGTPLYMSPEQAEFNNLDIDTRTDIYSLGAILYELLTGATPIERQQFKDAAWQEVLRLIKEVEPPKPSSRISSERSAQLGLSNPSKTSIFRRLTLQSAIRNPQLQDLDWIVMKALEKERSRRYETANGVAHDIERYLHDEPVEAGPPSATYRLKKLAHKHRRAMTTAATIALLLVAGTIISTWQAIRATNAKSAARASESKARIAEGQALAAAAAERRARQKAEAATAAESKAKASALEREAETKAVLDFVESRVFAAARPQGYAGGLGRDVSLREALARAINFVDESFQDRPLIEARVRSTLGTSFYHLGEAKTAAEQYEAARNLYAKHHGFDHPVTLRAMNNLASSYAVLGRHAEALNLAERTLALQKARLGLDHPDTLVTMNAVALNHKALGRHAEALKLLEETLALKMARFGADHPDTIIGMHNLANCYDAMGRHAEALKLREETLAWQRTKLGHDHPYTLNSMNNLAVSYYTLGRHAEALKLRDETLATQKTKLALDHPDTLNSMSNLARSYDALGRHAEALKLHEETFALRKTKLGPDHPDTLHSMHNLANCYDAMGRHAEALKLREETLALRKTKLGPDHPDTLTAMNNLANSYAALGRHTEALKLHEENLTLTKTKLGQDHPDAAVSMYNLANRYYALGRYAEALKLYKETLAVQKTKLGPDHPSTLLAANNLANTYYMLARHVEAVELREETLALQKRKLGLDHPDTLLTQWRLAESLVKLDRSAEAVPLIDAILQFAAGKIVDPSMIPGAIVLRLRHYEKGKDAAACRATAEMWENLRRSDAGSLYNAACWRSVTAAVIRAADESESAATEASAEANRAMDWLHKAVAAGYNNAAHMAQDKDLDALRDRDDFKQLLDALTADQKTKPN